MRRSGRGRATAMVTLTLSVMLALSLVLMHGFGLSHTSPAESPVPAMTSAHATTSDPATRGALDATVNHRAAQSGHQEPEQGHAGMLTRACLAVLGALVLAFASLLITTRPWHGLRRPAIPVLRLADPPMWWVHPRPHLLCVMRT